jgi:hypothetical protein
MATTSTLYTEVRAKTDKLQGDLNKAKSVFGSFGSVINSIGAGIVAAFSVRAITQFVTASVKAYDTQIKAEQQLLTSLKGRHGVQQALIQQAAYLQGRTLFGDEEIVRAQSLIAAFTKEESAIKKIIPLVLDLATAKGMDLTSAADLVSKTLGSTTNALARYGIAVEGNVGSTQRLTTLVNGLTSAFGGQAEAAAKVGLGPLTIMKNQVGEIAETFGKAIVETEKFGKVVEHLTWRAENLNEVFSSDKIKGWEKLLSVFFNNHLNYYSEIAEADRLLKEREASKINLWSHIGNQIADAQAALDLYNKSLLKNNELSKEQAKNFEFAKQGGDYPGAWHAPLDKPKESFMTEDVNFDYEGTTGERFFNPGTLGFYQTLLANYHDQLLDLDITSNAYAETQQKIIDLQAKLGTTTDTTAEAFAGLATQLTSIWGSAIEGAEGYEEAMRQTVKAIISMLVSEGIAHMIKNTIASNPELGPFALPLAAGAGIAAGALFDSLVPEFAKGGYVGGSSFTGDNVPIMANSGEAVLNAAQQRNFMALANGAGNQKIEITGRIVGEGTQLIGVIEKAKKYYSIVR